MNLGCVVYSWVPAGFMCPGEVANTAAYVYQSSITGVDNWIIWFKRLPGMSQCAPRVHFGKRLLSNAVAAVPHLWFTTRHAALTVCDPKAVAEVPSTVPRSTQLPLPSLSETVSRAPIRMTSLKSTSLPETCRT